jgi:hypothetical protein
MHLSQQQREHLGEVLVGKAEDKNWTLLNQQNAVDLQMDSNNDE